MTTYAIGDIHGHIDLLRRAHDRIAADGGGTVVHVGDLVDRGPMMSAITPPTAARCRM